MARTIIGLFSDGVAATHALTALLKAGFSQDQLGVVAPHRQDAPAPLTSDAAVSGGVLGATTGALLAATGVLVIPGIGPILAAGILASLAGGAAGWLTGTLVALGIEEEEARHSEARVQGGGTLIVVRPHHREEEAREILLRLGAEKVRAFGHAEPPPPPLAGAEGRQREHREEG